jgi:hypothetical protein
MKKEFFISTYTKKENDTMDRHFICHVDFCRLLAKIFKNVKAQYNP